MMGHQKFSAPEIIFQVIMMLMMAMVVMRKMIMVKHITVMGQLNRFQVIAIIVTFRNYHNDVDNDHHHLYSLAWPVRRPVGLESLSTIPL